MEKILIPAGPGEAEFTEKKSRFLSLALPVSDPEEVKTILKETRAAHPRSRHVVWAYILGDARSLFGLSDDGEPHGTAGRPVLEVLKGSGMTDILVLVVRYFGGVKLGTGGLVSAYTKAAQDCLEQVVPREKIPQTRCSLTIPYSRYEGLKKLLAAHEGEVLEERFETEIALELTLPAARFEEWAARLRDKTAGSVNIGKPRVAESREIG